MGWFPKQPNISSVSKHWLPFILLLPQNKPQPASRAVLTCWVFCKHNLCKGKCAFVSSTDVFCYMQLHQSSLQKLAEPAELLMGGWAGEGHWSVWAGNALTRVRELLHPPHLINISWVHLQGLGMEKAVHWWIPCLHCDSTPPCWWIKWINPSDTYFLSLQERTEIWTCTDVLLHYQQNKFECTTKQNGK